MGYFEVILTICMVSNQLSCAEKRFPFDSDGSPIQCAMAQPAIAAWIGDHPGWFVRRWSCESADRRKQDI
jgi:hypothetical protein